MTGMPIEQSCYWLARRPSRPVTPLAGDSETEIAIVGAGLTGLWTAIFLQQLAPRTSIVLLEAEIAAYGASGRNAGMLSETVDHGHGLAIQHFGEAEARRLAALGETNVEEMTGYLAARGIDCDYESSGRLVAALTDAQLEEARRSVATAKLLGLDSHHLLSRAEIRARLDSPLYLGGVQVTGGGILDPVKLVDGLRGEAERLGVRVHEHTPVESLARIGARIELRTPRGRLRARRAVLATSAYTHVLLPRVARRFIPLYDYILVSEPLAQSQRDAIGWAGREGVTDGRSFFNYYRLTRGRPDPVGHQRGGVLLGQPGGPQLRPFAGALRRPSGQLPAAFPGVERAGISLCLGRSHLLHHPAHAVLRPSDEQPGALRPGLHGPRAGHHENRGPDTGPHGPRPGG